MDREQIIKALECCSGIAKCIDCPYANIEDCAKQNTKDTIALIKALTEESDRLSKLLEETSRSASKIGIIAIVIHEHEIRMAIADTVQKIKRMIDKYFVDHNEIKYGGALIHKIIDQIAKEIINT